MKSITMLIMLALTSVAQIANAQFYRDSYIESQPRCSYCNRPHSGRCPLYIADERRREDYKIKEAQKKRDQDKKLAEHKEMLAQERAENIRKAQTPAVAAPPAARPAAQAVNAPAEVYVHDGPKLFSIPIGCPTKTTYDALRHLGYSLRKYEGASVIWVPSDRAGPLTQKNLKFDTKSIAVTAERDHAVGLRIESPAFETAEEASIWYTSAIGLIDSVFKDIKKIDNGDSHFYSDGEALTITVGLLRRAKTASIEIKAK